MATKATLRQTQTAMLFCAEGYMPSGASSITGNLSQESGRTLPSAFRTGSLDHGSQGLAQWRLSRLSDYKAYVKRTVDSDNTMTDAELWDEYGRLDLQVKYIVMEMQKDYPTLDASLRKGGKVASLTADICWQYERPSKYAANLANRIAQSEIIFASIPNGAAKAHETSIQAALDLQADTHTKQATGGAVAAMGGAALGGAAIVSHVAHGLHFWEWGVLAACALIVITGVIAALSNNTAAALIKSAKTDVNTAAPKAVTTPAPLTATMPKATTAPIRKSAKVAEADAIQAALHPAPAPALNPAPPVTPATVATYSLTAEPEK